MFSMILLYHMPTQLSLSPSASLLPCTVVAADFADSECEASAKSCYSTRAWSARVLCAVFNKN